MIDDLDEALRKLLVRELPVKNGEVDIQFHQPKREITARYSRPTLNLFLYDLRENLKLRYTASGWDVERRNDGTSIQRRRPFRADLHYIITAWAAEPEDEHRLLARTLMALFRVPELPDELVPTSLHDQPGPITLKVAQYDTGGNLTDLWSAMDNELRPAITCMVTLALNPYEMITGPLVRTRELRFGQAIEPVSEEALLKSGGAATYWTIGGTVRSKKPLDLDTLHLTLVERGLEVKLQPGGRFAIGNLEQGEYTLSITINGGKALSFKVKVPAPDYDIEL